MKSWLPLLFFCVHLAAAETLKINGSTTVNLPVAEAAEILRAGQKLDIQVDTQGGSAGGISMLGDGLVQIGMASKHVSDEDRAKYPAVKFNEIHSVVVAVIALLLAAPLGLSESQIVRAVLLPQAWGGLITGSLLGLARAAGETAPIMFTATNFAGATLPTGIKESPVLTLPCHIFILAQDSFDPAVGSKLWGAALVLLALVFFLSLLALPSRLMLPVTGRRVRRRFRRAATCP